MNVGELIERLQEFDREATVILSSDAEGNRYAPLHAQFGEGIYENHDLRECDPLEVPTALVLYPADR